MVEKILWKDIGIVIEVTEKEIAGRQTKFAGKIVKGNGPWKVGEFVETTFLYKSGFRTVK